MKTLYNLAKPFIFKLDPERAHNITLRTMKAGLVPSVKAVEDPALKIDAWGLTFNNPIGLSAGFDKNAEVIAPILDLGFGFTEVGTVTIKPQDGNPKPRVFRDPETESIINRLGFPNCGLNVFKANLERFLKKRHHYNGVVGINIGMNKGQTDPASDYIGLIRILGPLADYLTVNISSPNTPGLRDLQKPEFLRVLIADLKAARAEICSPDSLPPILIKFAPDLDDTQQEELAHAVVEAKIDGLILTNTTLDRPDTLPESFRAEKGGLSGTPVKEKSTQTIKNFYHLTKGQIPIIGVGGVSTGQDAYDKIKAGATLIQLYTGLVFQGPSVAQSINTELLSLLRTDGYTHISEAIGTDVKTA